MTAASELCVVMPTIREPEAIRSYVANARAHGFDTDRLHVTLVTESFCDTAEMERMLDALGVEGRVFDGPARDEWFRERGVGRYRHLIPEASHAQTSFGLLYAYERGSEVVVFLDDDTRPRGDQNFFGTHLANLGYEGEVTALDSDERWVNVLHESFDEHGLYPRGYPYSAMGETVERENVAVESGSVLASQGLWTNVPDLDAVRILNDGDLDGQAQTRLEPADYGTDFVVGRGSYLTVCSMNLAFRREVIPAFYQLPMDDNPWDVGRFDDIWSGLFLKRAADLLGGWVYTGDPLCRHDKAARSTFGDLANEAPGLELNEHVWRVIDRADPFADESRGATTSGAAAPATDGAGGLDDNVSSVSRDHTEPAAYHAVGRAMATALTEAGDEEWENAAFLRYCGEYFHDWLDCLSALDGADPGPVRAPDVDRPPVEGAARAADGGVRTDSPTTETTTEETE